MENQQEERGTKEKGSLCLSDSSFIVFLLFNLSYVNCDSASKVVNENRVIVCFVHFRDVHTHVSCVCLYSSSWHFSRI